MTAASQAFGLLLSVDRRIDRVVARMLPAFGGARSYMRQAGVFCAGMAMAFPDDGAPTTTTSFTAAALVVVVFVLARFMPDGECGDILVPWRIGTLVFEVVGLCAMLAAEGPTMHVALVAVTVAFVMSLFYALGRL